MILRMNNINIDLSEVKKNMKMEKEGVSAYEIIKTSKKYGLDAEGYKNYNLETASYPFIAHMINEDELQHFVVVIKKVNKKILLADPATSIMYIKEEDFLKKYTGVAIIFKRSENIIRDVLKNKRIIILIVIITLFSALLSILFSYTLSFVVQLINKNYKFNVILIFIFSFIMFGVFKELVNYIRITLSLKFKLLVDEIITKPVLAKLINLPYDYYQKSGSGELISKINDLSYLKEMISLLVENVFVNILIIIISLSIIMIINIKLILASLLLLFSFYVISKIYISKYFHYFYDLQRQNETFNNKIVDVFIGILNVKNLSKENYFINKILSYYDKVLNQYKVVSFKNNKITFILSILIVISNAILLYLMLIENTDLSNIIFIFSLQSIITDSINQIFNFIPLLINYKSAYLRIKSILEEENYDDSYSLNIQDIKFKNVTYKKDNKVILKDISFKIKQGQMVMIKGKTGIGKSTLFKILTKQINAYKGSIFLNGINIRRINKNTLVNNITFVDQKIRLFNTSIKENILLGNSDFKNVLKASMVDNFVLENKISYDYLIDNINSNLSGGQLQKIIIAQSLLNGKKIIIFDETTSQLDIETERKILLNIKKYYADRTIILITHRHNNEDLFDNVINLDNLNKLGGNNAKIKY